MIEDGKIVTVLIASPADVVEYRSVVEAAVLEWNVEGSVQAKVVFVPQRWEKNTTSELAEDTDAQDVINRQVGDDADCVISLWWYRLGTETPRAESGTAEEVKRQLAAGKHCSAYFCTRAIPEPARRRPNGEDQQQALGEFRGYLEGQGLVQEFGDEDELRRQVERLLNRWAADITKDQARRRKQEEAASLMAPRRPPAEVVHWPANAPRPGITRRSLVHTIREHLRQHQALLSSDAFGAGEVGEVARAVEQCMEPSLELAVELAESDDQIKQDVAPLVVDWIEALAVHPSRGGRVWKNAIRGYGGLLLSRLLVMAELRSGEPTLSAAVFHRSVHIPERGRVRPLLEALAGHRVFRDGADQLIDPDAERKYTPISDHIEPILGRYSPALTPAAIDGCFDLMELVVSLKQVELDDLPEFGKYTWTARSHHFIADALRPVPEGAAKTYEQRSIERLFWRGTDFHEVATGYDARLGGGRGVRREAYHPLTPLLHRTSAHQPIKPWGDIW
ncbi:MAG: hypothetical protein K0V04_29130 [Deltaproteobacteria bacterium]|nr:hypothetical protein [Deltaproteobacteria bacterium]